MSEGPKLYTNKPKKSQLKQVQQRQQPPLKSKGYSSSMEAPPPPPPPKESFARRYKFIWPLLLTVNLAVGAYLFMRTKKKDIDTEDGEVAQDVPASPVSTMAVTAAPVAEKPIPAPQITETLKVREPIPESQQRELFKWVLEEKRKIKPKDREERKRIDEEKAILKQLINAKSIPTI